MYPFPSPLCVCVFVSQKKRGNGMYGSVFWELDLFVRLSLLKITGNLVETFHSMLVSEGKALLIMIIINFFYKNLV